MEESSRNYGVAGGVIVLILAIASFGAFKYLKKDDNAALNTQANPVLVATTTGTVPKKEDVPAPSIYKDGTYSATGNYFSPGGAEEIKIEVTLKGDVIVDAKAEPQAFRPNSIKFQGIFTANFKPLVVGKKISEVQLTKVSGSSLTPKGFNDALAKIKVQAKV